MTPKTLIPPTPDRSLKGRIAQKRDLHARLMATAAEAPKSMTDFWEEMADEVQATIIELQLEGMHS